MDSSEEGELASLSVILLDEKVEENKPRNVALASGDISSSERAWCLLKLS